MTKGLFIFTAVVSTTITLWATAGSHSPITQRQEAMKAVGQQMRTLGGMAQGKIAYDDFDALSALELMRNAVFDAKDLFPQGSDTGAETRALPAIWAVDSSFDSRMTQLLVDLDAAIAAEPADKAAYIPLFGAVANGCRGCHELYRAPKN